MKKSRNQNLWKIRTIKFLCRLGEMNGQNDVACFPHNQILQSPINAVGHWTAGVGSRCNNWRGRKDTLKEEIVLVQVQLYCEYWEHLDILPREQLLLNPCTMNAGIPHVIKNDSYSNTPCLPSSLEYTLTQAQVIIWIYRLFDWSPTSFYCF